MKSTLPPDDGVRFLDATGAMWLCLGYAYTLANNERACSYELVRETLTRNRRREKIGYIGVFGDQFVAMDWKRL